MAPDCAHRREPSRINGASVEFPRFGKEDTVQENLTHNCGLKEATDV
jgi:hypothetical protein